MSIIKITWAEAMSIAAFQEHLDCTEKVNLYYKEHKQRWVHHNQSIFNHFPFGIDGDDQDATGLLSMVRDVLSVARGEV